MHSILSGLVLPLFLNLTVVPVVLLCSWRDVECIVSEGEGGNKITQPFTYIVYMLQQQPIRPLMMSREPLPQCPFKMYVGT